MEQTLNAFKMSDSVEHSDKQNVRMKCRMETSKEKQLKIITRKTRIAEKTKTEIMASTGETE